MQINDTKEDVVFVGSISLDYHIKLNREPKDIDITVTNLDGLSVFGKVEKFDTNSPFSILGKRAIIKREDYNIDVFIEKELPEFVINNNIKYETLNNKIAHYNRVINSTEDKYFLEYSKSMLNFIKERI